MKAYRRAIFHAGRRNPKRDKRPYFAVRKSRRIARGWYVCIVGRNGNEIMSSKVYGSKSNAKRAAEDVRGTKELVIEEQ